MPGVLSVARCAPGGYEYGGRPDDERSGQAGARRSGSGGYQGVGVGVAANRFGHRSRRSAAESARSTTSPTEASPRPRATTTAMGHTWPRRSAAAVHRRVVPGRRPGRVVRRPEGARREGQGNTSNVIDAIEFAIANKKTLDIDVINLSLGQRRTSRPPPIRWSVRSRSLGGRHRSRGVRWKHRHQPGDRDLRVTVAFSSPGNACSAYSQAGGRRRRAPRGTLRRRGRAPQLQVRRGPTATPNPIWWPPATRSPSPKSGSKPTRPSCRVRERETVSQPISLTGTNMSRRDVRRRGENDRCGDPKKLTPNLVKAILQGLGDDTARRSRPPTIE